MFCRLLVGLVMPPFRPFKILRWSKFLRTNHRYIFYDQRCLRKIKLLFLEHFCFLLVLLLIVVFLEIVDEVDEVLEVDYKLVKTSKTLLNQSSSPLIMSKKLFLCMSYSTSFWCIESCWIGDYLGGLFPITPHWHLHLIMTLPYYEGCVGWK